VYYKSASEDFTEEGYVQILRLKQRGLPITNSHAAQAAWRPINLASVFEKTCCSRVQILSSITKVTFNRRWWSSLQHADPLNILQASSISFNAAFAFNATAQHQRLYSSCLLNAFSRVAFFSRLTFR